jgi:hypothetical protein
MLERYNRKEHKQATAAKHANGEMLCQLQICDNVALNKGLSAITQLFKDAIDGCDRFWRDFRERVSATLSSTVTPIAELNLKAPDANDASSRLSAGMESIRGELLQACSLLTPGSSACSPLLETERRNLLLERFDCEIQLRMAEFQRQQQQSCEDGLSWLQRQFECVVLTQVRRQTNDILSECKRLDAIGRNAVSSFPDGQHLHTLVGAVKLTESSAVECCKTAFDTCVQALSSVDMVPQEFLLVCHPITLNFFPLDVSVVRSCQKCLKLDPVSKRRSCQ